MAIPDTPNNLREFTERFSSEDTCARYLFECRWPSGFVCPRCGTPKGYPLERRTRLECANPKCRYQVSVTARTIMHRTKQDLVTWFHAAYLVSTLTPGISAVQFQRQLGLSRYETAFTMLHKLRSAMVAPERELLHAEVEVDDGYIGGEETGRRGRGALSKALVACAVELVRWTDKNSGKDRVRTGRVRLRTIPDASTDSLLPFVRESVEQGAIVHTDGWPSYIALANEGYNHCPVVQGKDPEHLPHVHRIFSNLG